MPDMWGPYELRGELGRGAMAVVYRALDPTLDREVAIKQPLIPDALGETAMAALSARFVQEGRAAARLNHPNIVTIYGAYECDGKAGIVMELIEGWTLSSYCHSRCLDLTQSLSVVDQLLDAAGYAHARGVIHRDIKPDNIFLTPEGRVKLADFGIAHMDATTACLTQLGTVLGTPGYMSPEQALGREADQRSDLFSIGVIAYELATGQNPFGTEGSHPTSVIYRIVHEQPQDPRWVDPNLPDWLCAIIARAIAKDPNERYQSADEMREDLERSAYQQQGYIEASAPPAAFQAAQPAAALATSGEAPYIGVPATGTLSRPAQPAGASTDHGGSAVAAPDSNVQNEHLARIEEMDAHLTQWLEAEWSQAVTATTRIGSAYNDMLNRYLDWIADGRSRLEQALWRESTPSTEREFVWLLHVYDLLIQRVRLCLEATQEQQAGAGEDEVRAIIRRENDAHAEFDSALATFYRQP